MHLNLIIPYLSSNSHKITSRRTLKSPAYQKFYFYFVPVPGCFISSDQFIAVPPISKALPSFYSLLIVSTTVIFLICFAGPITARHTEPSIMNTITKSSHPGTLHSSPHLEVTRFWNRTLLRGSPITHPKRTPKTV